jgi:predicted enzyme related to lactoylglutathione lyase
MDHTVVHFEIPADNPERATRFYRELFGWEIQKMDFPGGPEYWTVSTVPTDGKGQPARPGVNGGLIRRQHPGHPPVNYVSVESVDEYARKAKRLGAEEVMAKTPVKGMGWFAWLKDTEGNVFGIWQTDDAAA